MNARWGGRAGGRGAGFVLHPQLPPEEHELFVVSTGAGVEQLPVLQLLEPDDVLQQPMEIFLCPCLHIDPTGPA